MSAGFLISLGAVAALVAGDIYPDRRRIKKKREEERREHKRIIKYNKAHLPPKELPPLSPDYKAAEELISNAPRLMLYTIDGKLYYRCSEELVRVSDDYDEDTLAFIEYIAKDVAWFHSHWVGEDLPEQYRGLEDFLREKYRLSNDCISRISFEFANQHIF